MRLLAPQAGELLLQECVVLRACLLAFQPLHIAFHPRVGTFRYKAREGLRGNEVRKAFLGALPEHARLPVPSLLIAVLPVGKLPQLSASFGIGDDLQSSLEGLADPIG